MKQFYLLLTLLAYTFTIQSQNINFPDANLKLKLVTQTNPTIDTNNDDEISVAEAAAVTGRLKIRGNGSTGRITDLTGIEFFINATEIEADNNELTAVDLSANTALTFVNLGSNDLTMVDFSNNTALEFINVQSNNLSQLDVSNLTNLKTLGCTNMLMTSLNVTNCVQLETLSCAINQFTSLDLSTNTSLKTLFAHSLPNLTSLDLSNNTQLESIECGGAGFSTLDVSNNPLLTFLDCSFSQVSNLVFGSNNTVLTTVDSRESQLSSIDTSLLSGLTELILSNNLLTSIDVSQNTNLEILDLDENQLTTIDLESNPNINDVSLVNNQLQTVYLRNGNNPQLSTLKLNFNPALYCVFVDDKNINYPSWFRGGAVTFVETEAECTVASEVTIIPDPKFEQELILQGYDTSPSNGETPTSKINGITELDVEFEDISDLTGIEAFTALEVLDCDFNPITNLDVSANSALRSISGRFMDLETVNFGANPNLTGVNLEQNELTTIDVSQLPNLQGLRVNNNDLTALDLTNNLSVISLFVNDNPMTQLDIRNLNIRTMNSRNTLIETLDFSNSDNINIISIQNNPNLTYVNFKSGGNENIQQIFSITFSGLPNLQTACVDDVNNVLASRIQSWTDQEVTITEDCLNEISGTVLYDIDGNGCDSSDIALQNLMVESASVVDTTATFTSMSGTYVNFVKANAYTTNIVSSLPSYFTVTNPSQNSVFNDFNEQDTVDFCVEANQSIEDVDITFIPTSEARPGFDASYQLIYNNIGTNLVTGSITVNFDDAILTFLSASEAIASQDSNSLIFDFTNLNPFESRFINLEFNVFPPPTVNDGDVLMFTANISPSANDFTPDDNTYTIEQTVVNSFDPNDKRVLQGNSIFEEETGNYLDYIVRFQNTGSASAINVRIEDVLDDKLEWTTLQPMSSSHDYVVRITNDNFVEFIFDAINLPPQSESEALSQGYIAFRIKPKTDVTVGDIISSTAAIYFDFNAPIITNTVSTEVVAPLNTQDFSLNTFKIYPNPSKASLNVSSRQIINSLRVFDSNGRTYIYENPLDRAINLDISDLANGIYFIALQSGNLKSTRKFIKQ